MATFSRQDIVDGLQRLGQLAEQQGIHIKLTLLGGAAMVLGFDARQSTRDVDVVILAPEEARLVRKLARLVAEERDWPEDWLNDGAKGYMVGISSGPQLFSAPGIEAWSPSFYQLLALKLSAWRDDVDISDARRLLTEVVGQNQARDEIWQQVEPFLVPGDELTAQYAFQDLWRHYMEIIEQMAEAALLRNSLHLRSLVQDWVRSGLPVNSLHHPNTTDPNILIVSAALVELLALRLGQIPPDWTQEIGALAEPFFLVESAASMKRLRALCEAQSPEPLRKRKLYAPPHFLEFA